MLCKIHQIGHEHYDPDTDGRSGERPGAQKLTAEDDPLLFEMRKKGSREERAVQISESLNNQGRDAGATRCGGLARSAGPLRTACGR